MRAVVLGFVVIGILTPRIIAADQLDDLFASWAKAQAGVRSLIVEYTVETNDAVFDRTEKVNCTIRLLRKEDGGICASCAWATEQKGATRHDLITYLFSNGSVYKLIHDKKQAVRFNTDGDLPAFLERYFNPLLILLDRKRAQERYVLEIVKADEWYTYLSLRPKNPKTTGWFPDILQGGLVLSNKETAEVPKDMPRQMTVRYGGAAQIKLDIKSWRWNGPGAPKPEEFTIPENRPGWEVLGIPLKAPIK